MDYFELKLALAALSALLIFAYMMYLQKKNDDEAEKKFQRVLKQIAAKYDDLQEKNSERSDLQSKTDKDSQ